jgi:hypothetical protein
MRQNVDGNPEYVRDRIEDTNDLGRKYLVSVALCAMLIATIEGGLHGFGLFTEFSSVSAHQANQTPKKPATPQICAVGGSVNQATGAAPLYEYHKNSEFGRRQPRLG